MGRQAEHRDGGGLKRALAAEILAVLGRPELARVLAAARRRLEEGDHARSFTLSDLTEAEAGALASLLGSATVARKSVRVSLAALDRALSRSRLAIGLPEALALLGGPLANRRAERAVAGRERASMWETALAHAAVSRHPSLALWLHELRGSGALLRSANASATTEQEMLGRALDLLARLPAPGVALSVLAAEVTGDAHALDPDRSLGGLVLRAGARLLSAREPASAAERRHLWAALGVLCDPLSAHVLVLGLRVSGGGMVGRQLSEYAEAGEPRRLTLRELGREPLGGLETTTVFVCENPIVVAAAADDLGPACAALVCTEGMPSSAATALLETLAAAGARLRMHADFDWGGVRIGNLLASRLAGVEPWRFSRADYEAAISYCAEAAPLCGTPVAACWDAELAAALAATGKAVLEEQMLARLLDDLL